MDVAAFLRLDVELLYDFSLIDVSLIPRPFAAFKISTEKLAMK